MTNRDILDSGHLIARNVEALALTTINDTPVTVIQGARQVGKSTLASMLAVELNSRQVTFDNPSSLQAAREDPVGFAEQYPEGTLIIDEVQLFPQILRTIKLAVDANRRPGRFIITGSADLLHVAGANESLAGRAETIRLFPFSQGEMGGYKEDFVKTILSEDPLASSCRTEPLKRKNYAAIVAKGGYPEAILREPRRRKSFFRNYLKSVLDHDAVNLSGLAHLDKLSLLFSLLAAQTSGELVKANLAKLVGIPQTSIHAYIRLLSDLCLIHELPAWGRNVSKRAVGRSKLSFDDTGLASFLNGESAESLTDIMHGERFGSLLESLAVNELQKQQAWSDCDYSLYHYRDKDQREVDILIELFDGRVICLEIKATQTVLRKHFSSLRHLRDLLKERFVGGFVLYAGEESLPFGDKLFALPLCTLWNKPSHNGVSD
jgi:predicted AAA+ superfamily ATPase